MSKLANAIHNTPDTLTDNGAATFSTTLNSNVDFFFKSGASRSDVKGAVNMFKAAYKEDPQLALRNLLRLRDARYGAGERNLFRVIVANELDPETLLKLIPHVPEYGRFDDLGPLVMHKNPEVSRAAALLWKQAVLDGNGLAAKWAPRKGELSLKLRFIWEMSPRTYRKTLVNNTNVVEQKMCAQEWDDINFEHVPSVAMSRYRTAFFRNAESAMDKFVSRVKKGTAKVHATAVFPHDILLSALQGGSVDICDEQWKALPNWIPEGKSVLTMVDVSGSMGFAVSNSITAMHISASLGLYTAERLTGPFKNQVLTFSEEPSFVEINPNRPLVDRIRQVIGMKWGMSTDLEAAFEEMLKLAKKTGCDDSDMPDTLLIISDMEFNQSERRKNTSFEAVKKKFKKAGYVMPEVVFWNVRSGNSNAPVRFDTSGVALVSGYSPAVLKGVLSNTEVFTPVNMMVNSLLVDRYDIAGLTL